VATELDRRREPASGNKLINAGSSEARFFFDPRQPENAVFGHPTPVSRQKKAHQCPIKWTAGRPTIDTLRMSGSLPMQLILKPKKNLVNSKISSGWMGSQEYGQSTVNAPF
jgi:hypothetical protein